MTSEYLRTLVAVVDGDDLEAGRDAGAFVAEIVEPDIAAAVAHHNALIVLEVRLGVVLHDIGLQLRADDSRIMLEEPALAADHLFRLAEIIDGKMKVVGQPVLVVV